MNKNLKIRVSKTPPEDALVSCKKVSIKKKFYKKLFGNDNKMTIIVPGDSVKDITISEVAEGGGGNNAKSK